MIKTKKQMYIVIMSFILIVLLGTTTYAFFNYARTGLANTIRVGRISFNTTQEGQMVLTNVFPMSRDDIDNDLEEGNNVTINITGSTTYSKGIEYLVTAEDVNITVNEKRVPVSLYVASTSDLGTPDEDYFFDRGEDTSIYKVLSGGIVEDGQYILAGYIAPGQTGINGSLSIKAFIDEDYIAISDTYDGTGTGAMGTTSEWVNNRTVFTTSEWNSIKEGNALSFKIRVEANEGTWVDEYAIPNVMNSLNFNRSAVNVKEIRFIQESPLRMQSRYDASVGSESNGTKMDLTYNNIGKVLAWIEPYNSTLTGTTSSLDVKPSLLVNDDTNYNLRQIDNEESYILYVASSGKTQWMTGSSLISGFTTVEKILFENTDSSNVTDMSYMFYNCSKLTNVNMSALNTDSVIYMDNMFYGATNLTSVDLSGLGSDTLVSIGGMFYNCNNLKTIIMKNFNFGTVNFYNSVHGGWTNYYYAFSYLPNVETIDLTNADTSEVTNMFDMFYNCSKLKNVYLDGIDTSNVTNMGYMFYGCSSLENIDLDIDTSNVQFFGYMFYGCSSLESIDFNLNTNSAQYMAYMFEYCTNLESVSFRGTESNSLSNIDYMFYGCTKLTNLSLIGIGGNNLNSSISLFGNCTSLKNIDMSNVNFGVINFGTGSNSIFYPLQSTLETVNLSGANFSGPNVTTNSFYALFEYFNKLKSVNFKNANTSKVTNFMDLFGGCNALESVNLEGIDTSNVTNMAYMFSNCDGIVTLDLRNLNTSKVTNMGYMFQLMDNLEEINISGWGNNNLSNVYHMFANSNKINTIIMNNFNFGVSNDANLFNYDSSYSNPALETVYLNNSIFGQSTSRMFDGCSNLKNVYLNGVNPSRVTSMNAMFKGCTSLVTVDLSSFSTSNVTNMSSMFSGDINLTTIYVSNNWSTAGVNNSSTMFYNCTSLVGGSGTTYDSSCYDKTYAHIDGGQSDPGYLTLKTS